MVKASAPGNVFFFGEHAVVYERPAIVAAVDLRINSEIKKREDGRVIINHNHYGSFEGSLEELKEKEWTVKIAAPDESAINDYSGDNLAPLKDLIGRVAQIHDLKEGLEMNVGGDMPKNSGGLSSSTAVLSSVLGSLNKTYNLGIETLDFFDILLPFQVKIHGGAASGSEIISSSVGGYNKIRINRNGPSPILERQNLGKLEFNIVIGNTGVLGLTSETVQYVRSGFNGDCQSYGSVFDRIAEIVNLGEKAIKSGDVKLIGQLMDENHEILARDLGVSHPKLNKLVDAARRGGAYGAKLSGGGRGGVMIALVDKNSEERVAKSIEFAGGTPYITKVGCGGLKIEN